MDHRILNLPIEQFLHSNRTNLDVQRKYQLILNSSIRKNIDSYELYCKQLHVDLMIWTNEVDLS